MRKELEEKKNGDKNLVWTGEIIFQIWILL